MGGLADYVSTPADIAIEVEGGQLNALLLPLASDSVATIVGFTEVDRRGQLQIRLQFLHRGAVVGIYRKLHPAINKSVYEPGDKMPVFTVGDVTFGIMICLDSNHRAGENHRGWSDGAVCPHEQWPPANEGWAGTGGVGKES